jgi:uncharacterized protein YrrD
LKSMIRYKIQARDGDIGDVDDFYFDDKHWIVRYLVANTGTWLPDRQVLLSPYSLIGTNAEPNSVSINLTRKQIEKSPRICSDKPVSKQFESDYYGYYGWPEYSGGPLGWGYYPYVESHPELWKKNVPAGKKWDPHLRSTKEVEGYHVKTIDGELGHVDDFLIDTKTWKIRYLVIDIHNWLPDMKVLISTAWLDRISSGDREVFVSLTRDSIKASPAFTNASLVTRDFEKALFAHHGPRGHWLRLPAA